MMWKAMLRLHDVLYILEFSPLVLVKLLDEWRVGDPRIFHGGGSG